jgi:Tfp pilus assembly protein PilF
VERDPTVYGAASYATLGGLYADADVPGFRSSSRKKARLYLDKALALDPQGAPQNLSLGWLSFKENDRAAALRLATAASNAPARPGREKADADLRARATALIAAVNEAR